jgi:hypothetical protein
LRSWVLPADTYGRGAETGKRQLLSSSSG